MSDEELSPHLDAAIEHYASHWRAMQAGKTGGMGMLVAFVVKRTQGKADARENLGVVDGASARLDSLKTLEKIL